VVFSRHGDLALRPSLSSFPPPPLAKATQTRALLWLDSVALRYLFISRDACDIPRTPAYYHSSRDASERVKNTAFQAV
jgi:hypothetical protein